MTKPVINDSMLKQVKHGNSCRIILDIQQFLNCVDFIKLRPASYYERLFVLTECTARRHSANAGCRSVYVVHSSAAALPSECS